MNISDETRRAIYRDYLDRTNKVEALEQKYGVPRSAIARIAVEQGAPPRYSKRYGKKRGANTAKICPKCRKTIDINGAKFCCYCGADMRSERELLAEKVEKVMAFIRFLPQTERDEVQQILLSVIEELKK